MVLLESETGYQWSKVEDLAQLLLANSCFLLYVPYGLQIFLP